MTSFILPMYKKLELLQMAYPFCDCYRAPDTEVVLVLDEPSEADGVLAFVKASYETKFRVLLNEKEHAWRPPCVPYNVGIRHALGQIVAMADPESVILVSYLPHLLQLPVSGMTWALEGRPTIENLRITEATTSPWLLSYGLLIVSKSHMETICGYDESRVGYGDDDTDVRMRLCRLGLPLAIDPTLKVFHQMHDNEVGRKMGGEPRSPNIVLEKQAKTWGKEYDKVIWDWNKQ